MSKLFMGVLAFYGTVGVPLLYLVGLYLISIGNTSVFKIDTVVAGLILAFIGMGVWIHSYLALGKAFGVLPRRQTRIRRGLYRYYAHPMYLGILFTYLGLAVANQSLQGLTFTLIILLPLLYVRSLWETQKLQS